MLFNSSIFIFIFLPTTFFIYFYLNKKKLTVASRVELVFASLFFYSWWNIAYLPIILASMIVNYHIATTINSGYKRNLSKKTILIFGITSNLLLLGYFKYYDFFIENINLVTDSSIPLLHLALPLAISFFTFQQIAYLIDTYRGETKEYGILHYALFVTFFPQLIAGPIVHHSEMMPQFENKYNLVKNYKNILMGLFIFSIGLFKKVVLADSFAVWATAGFDTSTSLNLWEAWATSLSYTFQLYFDFSGYADMAIGIALMFNIKLPINFNSPYKALDIQDFWRRWHITLSRFLRDYIYIPLGGNRKGSFHTYSNLIATFILGGIWHGAGWTFVFWGLLHGLALIIYRLWRNFGYNIPKVISWLITFNFINITWVFFRANEWNDAIKIISAMFQLENIGVRFSNFTTAISTDNNVIIWIIAGFFITLFFQNSTQLIKYPELLPAKKIHRFKLVIFALISFVALSIMSIQTYTEFIYFNF